MDKEILLKDRNKFEYVCYLNEKWFYTTNHQNKIKKLPKGKNEEEGVDTVVLPKIISRCVPVNSIFLGVVSQTLPCRLLNNKVLLEQ